MKHLRLLLVGLLGVTCAALVACGSSGTGLIPAASAGPLQGDFEAVAQAAKTGNGDCTATHEAIAKTEEDFQRLPSSVNSGLRARLRTGIANLSARARALCTQPLAGVTTATTPTTSTSTTTSQTTTSSTSTSTSSTLSTPTVTQSTPTATGPPAPGGGTPVPGEGGGTPGASNGQGNGEGNGAGAGGAGVGDGNGRGNGEGNGQGGGK
ncbi:MAG TPA: hypothetical protein VGY76_13770 [Solirubrobacteraceae bacterium]|nr:hypothetical protein [Solirubrobacteraceae bacterium]